MQQMQKSMGSQKMKLHYKQSTNKIITETMNLHSVIRTTRVTLGELEEQQQSLSDWHVWNAVDNLVHFRDCVDMLSKHSMENGKDSQVQPF